MSQSLLSLPPTLTSGNWGALSKRLSVRASDSVKTSAFKMLDCFDQSIRASAALLIETGGELLLLDEEGTMWRQSAERTGNFVSDLCDGPVKARLSYISPLRCLLDLGQGRIDRTALRFVDDEEKTHLRAQALVFSREGQAATLLLVEGVRGYGKSEKRFTKRLIGAGASPSDPLEVTHSLFSDLEPYSAKPRLGFDASTTAFDAANEIVSAYLGVARQNEPGLIADFDTEFLHDYRIALRKIRSVLSLFKGVYGDAATADLKRRFSNLMAPTGMLRDLDVYLLEQDLYFGMLPENLHDGLRLMFAAFEEDRRAAHSEMSKRLKSIAYNREIAGLQSMFESSDEIVQGSLGGLNVSDYAQKLIWKRYRKLCKTAAQIDDSTPDEKVHELRILCKKLRYLIEFFAPQFDPVEIKAILKPLKRLQDNLGLFNDYSVQQERLQTLIQSGRFKGRTALATAQSIGALISVLHSRQLQERARVVKNFSRFNSVETRQRFRNLFHQNVVQP